MKSRRETLEFAVLGLLHDAPMHGYELRKELNLLLGSFRAISYGTLYPCLKRLEAAGLISNPEEVGTASPARAKPLRGRRARIIYQVTRVGKNRFDDEIAHAGPTAWGDEAFGVRFAFFAQTDPATRLKILEGRWARLAERLETVRNALDQSRERMDEYTLELQQYGLEQVEHELRWLEGLINSERGRGPRGSSMTKRKRKQL